MNRPASQGDMARAGNCKSVESAIREPNIATALFADIVRTDYERHGTPLYVLAWAGGASSAHVVRPAKNADDDIAIEIASIPITGIRLSHIHRVAAHLGGRGSPALLSSFPGVAALSPRVRTPVLPAFAFHFLEKSAS